MPWTGYDPQQSGGPIDVTGGGMDPSYAWALTPGRFNGDEWAYLEYLAAKDPSASRTADGIGPGDADPNYKAPKLPGNGALSKIINALLALHQKNVTDHSGLSNPGDPQQGNVQSAFSGPGAAYGPLTGPTRGLFDQGNDGIFDGPEGRGDLGTVGGAPSGGKHHGGGGGGYTGPSGPVVPTAQPYQAHFLAWQPTNTGTPRFTGPAGPTSPAPAPAAAPGKQPPPGGYQGRWRGPNRGGSGAGSSSPSPAADGGGATSSGGGDLSVAEAARQLGLDPKTINDLIAGVSGSGVAAGNVPEGGPRGRYDFGQNDFLGYDTNMLSMNAPGTLRDPSFGVYDTSGMPNPTPFMKNPGETSDDYMTRLHDAGFGMDDIGKLMSMQSGWGGWGTVVGNQGGGGYHFANQQPAGGGGGSNAMGGIGNIMNPLINLY